MPAGQRHTHAMLQIHLTCCSPVDFIGADHTAAAAGQFITDSPVLIRVITDGQNHAGLEDEYRASAYRLSGRRAATSKAYSRCACGVSGITDSRNFLSHRLTRSRRNVPRRQPRTGIVILIERALIQRAIVGIVFILRFLRRTVAEEMPIRAERLRHLRHLHVVHQAKRQHSFRPSALAADRAPAA